MKKRIFFVIFSFVIANNVFAIQDLGKGTSPTIIKSDKINKEDKDIIKAIGDVEIKKDGNILKAKEIEYNQTTKKIKANSDVKVYSEGSGDLFFSRIAEISDDFKIGNFNDGLLIFKNGSDIQSRYIDKISEDEIYAYNSDYSLCPTNKYNINLDYEQALEEFNREQTPLFSLKSKKVLSNTKEDELSFWRTSIWFWKLPIFYMPRLTISLHDDTSGIGIPRIEHNSNYGYGAYIPYKIRLTNGQRLILQPKIYQKGNYLLNSWYTAKSKEINKWRINIEGDITNDNGQSENLTNASGIREIDEGTYNSWRGFISSNGFYNFNNLWDFNYNAEIIGDEYYLRDYYQENHSYIQSKLAFTRINMKETENFNYFQFTNLFYQELLEENLGYNTPRYIPITNTNIQNTISKNQSNNLYYKLNINTTNLFRKSSYRYNGAIQYNRASLTPSLNNSFNSKFGTINSNLELKTDIYAINEVNTDNEIYDSNENRILPQLNLTWKKNFYSNNFLFQPIIKYSVTPNSNSFEDKIPNEDSEAQMLSFENIFSNNRYAGYDRQEFGNRITYGFESSVNNLNFGIAQGYRDNIKEYSDNPIIGFDYESVSDYVGYASYIINNNFDIYYKFLADRKDYDLKTNEVTLNFVNDDFSTYIGYTNIKPNLLYTEEQEQLNLGMAMKLFYGWKLSFSTVLDIQNDNRLLESKSSLVYDGNCTIWELNYRTYNPLSETKRNTSISLSLKVKFL